MGLNEYRVEFKIKGIKSTLISEETKTCICSEFVRVRNLAVEELNNYYEKWNNEFNSTHDVNDMDEYHKFIEEKQNSILRKYDYLSPLINIRSFAEDDCDLVAVVKGHPDIKVYLGLRPVEAW